MTYKTITTKSPFLGWMCETHISLGTSAAGLQRKLVFTTCKRHSKEITTTATVFEFDTKTSSRTTAVFQDYSKTVCTHDRCRATQANVQACHEEAKHEFGKHADAAFEHYAHEEDK